jgi:hypothetical protein
VNRTASLTGRRPALSTPGLSASCVRVPICRAYGGGSTAAAAVLVPRKEIVATRRALRGLVAEGLRSLTICDADVSAPYKGKTTLRSCATRCMRKGKVEPSTPSSGTAVPARSSVPASCSEPQPRFPECAWGG